MKTFSITKLIFLAFLLSGIIFLNYFSGCVENSVSSNAPPPGDLIGQWTLESQTGSLQDICDDEVVQFDSNGIATLQCPNDTAITRSYTVTGSILKYNTGIEYTISTLDSANLTLQGRNVSRNLFYKKIEITTTKFSIKNMNSKTNSSE